MSEFLPGGPGSYEGLPMGRQCLAKLSKGDCQLSLFAGLATGSQPTCVIIVSSGACSICFLAMVLDGTGISKPLVRLVAVVPSRGEPSVITPNLNDGPCPPGKLDTYKSADSQGNSRRCT